MSSPVRLTVAEVFAEFKDDLKLRWVAGENGGQRILTRELSARQRPRLLGPLNFNSSNRIQLLGPAETRLYQQPTELEANRFEYTLIDGCDLFIITDGHEPPASVVTLANDANIPLFVSKLPYAELHKNLRYRLTQQLAEREIIHGVMMDVHGNGVLITGDASVGKSELALELISRGHILVADDAPEFRRIAPGTLECRCPTLLQDFLEVRGLGILNIARMYGDAHTRQRKILRFIVHLQAISGVDFELTLDQTSNDRIGTAEAEQVILGVSIPQRIIAVAPGRNLAVLVEAAVREYILRSGGYNATNEFIQKQSRAIAKQ